MINASGYVHLRACLGMVWCGGRGCIFSFWRAIFLHSDVLRPRLCLSICAVIYRLCVSAAFVLSPNGPPSKPLTHSNAPLLFRRCLIQVEALLALKEGFYGPQKSAGVAIEATPR